MVGGPYAQPPIALRLPSNGVTLTGGGGDFDCLIKLMDVYFLP